MLSFRRMRALGACLALTLAALALPTPRIEADDPPVVTYQVVAVYDAEVTVDGQAAQEGVDYAPEAVITIDAGAEAYVLLSRNEDGTPVAYTEYNSSTDGATIADVTDQFIWIDD
jgi:hypothetical protein